MLSYGVRSIIAFKQSANREHLVEERVFVLTIAHDADAIHAAEERIRQYCEKFGHEYTPYFELYEMEDTCSCDEVFSFVHDWDGTVDEFVRQRLPHLLE